MPTVAGGVSIGPGAAAELHRGAQLEAAAVSSCCCGNWSLAVRAVKASRRDIKRARKAHRCVECDRVIPRGAPYRYETALMAGKWYQYHTCTLCAAIRDDRFSCGWTWGELWADLCACYEVSLEDDWSDSGWLEPPTHTIKGTS